MDTKDAQICAERFLKRTGQQPSDADIAKEHVLYLQELASAPKAVEPAPEPTSDEVMVEAAPAQETEAQPEPESEPEEPKDEQPVRKGFFS